MALSVFALVKITGLQFQIEIDNGIAFFSFFGTIVAYNFVKYATLVSVQKRKIRRQLKGIALLSLVALVATGFYFFQLQKHTQMSAVVFLVLTLLYTLPFFPNLKNTRNWSGIKIYIVALCWVGVSLVLPVINAGISFSFGLYFIFVQRFILVFVLTLIFEIIDLKTDDLHLQTVPQQIGVKKTKWLGYLLLLLFCGLEFLNSNGNINFQNFFIPLPLVIAVAIALFIFYANENRSKYYTSFWVESVPILWWFLLLLMK